MELSENDKKAITKAEDEYFEFHKISTVCPRCSSLFEVEEIGNSYIVRCPKGCMKNEVRGL